MRAAASGKRPRYNEDGDGNSSTSGSEDGDAAPSRKLPKIGAATPASQRKLPPAPKAARKAVVREEPSSGRKNGHHQDAGMPCHNLSDTLSSTRSIPL